MYPFLIYEFDVYLDLLIFPIDNLKPINRKGIFINDVSNIKLFYSIKHLLIIHKDFKI